MTMYTSLEAFSRVTGVTEVVAGCGVFDGVHLGHRRVMACALEMAARLRATPIMITFQPHPRAVLHPSRAPRALTSPEQKSRLFAEAGFAGTVFLPFTREFAALEPEAFIHRITGGPVRVRGLCVGENWRFGHGGAGTAALLKELGKKHGFEVGVAPGFSLEGSLVSSTRIRQAISHGHLDEAARLLGAPYSIYGEVVHGRGVGSRDLSCPTANLAAPGMLQPHPGIHVARARLPGGAVAEGIVYIGTCPTFADGHAEPTLELHLFDFHDDLYGKHLEVELLHFLRPEQRFDSPAALKAQILLDIAQAKAWHDAHRA